MKKHGEIYQSESNKITYMGMELKSTSINLKAI